MLVSFLISVLLVPYVTTDGSKGKSDLELITEDFQILARVTNALALQTAAAQKTVTARQLIVEFLKIAPEDFSEITKIDAANAISTLTELKERLSKVSDQVLSSDDAQKSFKDSLDKLEKSFEMAKNWTVKIDTITQDMSDSLTALKANYSSLVDIWDPSIFGRFYRFKWFLEKPEAIENDQEIEKNVPCLMEFLENFDKFLAFYSSLPEYGESLENLPILDTIMEYERAKETAVELPKILETFQKHFDDLKKDLDVTSPGWKKSEDSAGSVSDQIKNVYNAHKMYTSKLDPPLPSFTIAFLEPSDLLKVFDDLKTHWFEQHIAHGAYIDNLENSLKPFRQVAEKIIALETTWKPFQLHGGVVPNGEAVEEVVDRLAAIEKFVQDGFLMPVEQFVESLKSVLTECVKTDAKLEQTLKTFEKQEELQNNALTSIRAMERFINNDMLVFLDFKNTTKYVKCLTEMKNKMPDNITNRTLVETVQAMKNTFWACSKKIEFHEFMEFFDKLNGNLIRMEHSIVFFKHTSGPLTFKGVLEPGVNSINCLRDKKFDISNLLRLFDFVLSLRNFPGPEKIDNTTEYLSKLNEVRSAVDEVETMVREMPKSDSETVPLPRMPQFVSETMAVCTKALALLVNVRKHRQQLLEVGNNFDGNRYMMVTGDFLKPEPLIATLLEQADDIDSLSKTLRLQSLSEMSKIFEEMTKIDGLGGNREYVRGLSIAYKDEPEFEKVAKEWETLATFDLDFRLFHRRLEDGFVTVNVLREYFDQVFGRVKEPERIEVRDKSQDTWNIILSASISFVLLIVIAAEIVYVID